MLINAAREPEITDLADLPRGDGRADRRDRHATGCGSSASPRLHGATHSIIPDRIETGTYIMAAAATGGEVRLTGTRLDLVAAVARILEGAGVEVAETADGLTVRRHAERLDGVDVMTEPYPGFPTDLQAQIMALMTIADGASMITETIFENRFMHVPELARMGANINVHGASALVRGVPRLMGAPVMATDLRASVSLVVAGLAAAGETVINRVYHLDRGYERLEEKLAGLRRPDREAARWRLTRARGAQAARRGRRRSGGDLGLSAGRARRRSRPRLCAGGAQLSVRRQPIPLGKRARARRPARPAIERVLCGDHVQRGGGVSYRGFRRSDDDRILSLLAIRPGDSNGRESISNFPAARRSGSRSRASCATPGSRRAVADPMAAPPRCG